MTATKVRPTNTVSFRDANRRRTRVAASRQVVEARRAIRTMEKFVSQPEADMWGGCHAVYQRALMLRIAHPTATLAQIAAVQGVTKDTYAAQLRRAFIYATKLGNRSASRQGAR